MTAFLILAALLALLLLGIPVAFALGGLGLALFMIQDFNLIMVPQSLYSSIDNFVLLAIPLFLLMSNILLKCGAGQQLFAAAQSWVGHWPGGLGVATIISCGLFAAISGSSVATAATIGTIAVPEMTARGYPKKFVLGLLAAGGTLGILIPPSIVMIVYGVITEESIIDLFIAGIGPGIFLVLLFSAYSIVYARYKGDFENVERASWPARVKATLAAFPTMFIAVVIILGIYLGIFTPTEAAGVGLFLAIVITLVFRTMTLQRLKDACMDSMRTTVTILLIIAGAKIFAKAITLYQIPVSVSNLVTASFSEPWSFTLAICVVLLFMGLFLEALGMLLIMMPVLYPSLLAMGIDPIWFGIVFVIMVECALITPPVGLNLFIMQAVGKSTLGEVSRGVIPFIVMMLTTVFVLYFWPGLAMDLVRIL
tara:strand:- start:1359 stop:2630 length:1272 start_codon:yes stop_codon:yes gene_type:complete